MYLQLQALGKACPLGLIDALIKEKVKAGVNLEKAFAVNLHVWNRYCDFKVSLSSKYTACQKWFCS